MKAIWNGQVIAQAAQTIVLEGNHYFPRESLNMTFFTPSKTSSICSWKGMANYFSLQVDGKSNPDAAWYYAEPMAAAAQIADHVAFWRGVQVLED